MSDGLYVRRSICQTVSRSHYVSVVDSQEHMTASTWVLKAWKQRQFRGLTPRGVGWRGDVRVCCGVIQACCSANNGHNVAEEYSSSDKEGYIYHSLLYLFSSG